MEFSIYSGFIQRKKVNEVKDFKFGNKKEVENLWFTKEQKSGEKSLFVQRKSELNEKTLKRERERERERERRYNEAIVKDKAAQRKMKKKRNQIEKKTKK